MMNQRLAIIASTALSALILTGAILFPGAILAQEVPKTLKQGMSYAKARQVLTGAGWQAVKPSIQGDRSDTMNYLIRKLGFKEVESCSGTGMGFCRFSFADAKGRKLAIVTVNNQPGQQPQLYRWWIISQK